MRYADDFSIYVKSKKSAKRVGNSIYKFLRDKLQWPINRDKSGIRRPSTFEILGYSLYRYTKREHRANINSLLRNQNGRNLS